MNIRELRIGNLVKCNISNDAGIYTVQAIDGINLKIYLTSPRNVWHTEDKIKPIPLTEGWLLKFGFIQDSNGYFFANDKTSLSFTISKYGEFQPCFNDRLLKSGFSIKFVHQLQNLYFALAGEDLRVL